MLLSPYIILAMAVSLPSINANGLAECHKRVKVFELLKSLILIIIFYKRHTSRTPFPAWRGQKIASVRGLLALIDQRE